MALAGLWWDENGACAGSLTPQGAPSTCIAPNCWPERCEWSPSRSEVCSTSSCCNTSTAAHKLRVNNPSSRSARNTELATCKM
eukprot:440939-Pyramimonas_sp.AAC.1